MALFSKKAETTPKKTTEKEKKSARVKKLPVVAEKTVAPSKKGGLNLSQVLIRPHVTEKATDLSERGVYAFDVNPLANKAQVRLAVEKYYKVSPARVAIVAITSKMMRNPRTGRTQTKRQGGKKALVYLKAGDKIEFV